MKPQETQYKPLIAYLGLKMKRPNIIGAEYYHFILDSSCELFLKTTEIIEFAGGSDFIINLKSGGYKLLFDCMRDPGLSQKDDLSKFIQYIMDEYKFTPHVEIINCSNFADPGAFLTFVTKKWSYL